MIDLVEEADALGSDIGLQTGDGVVETKVATLLDHPLRLGGCDRRGGMGR